MVSLERILHTHDTPRRTAAAFAIGVFWGFSPVLGLHTALGLLCAFALNLNRVAVLLGVYSNVPWILPGYYALATAVGAALLGAEVPPEAARRAWSELEHFSLSAIGSAWDALSPLLWSYLLGSTLGALVLSAIGYWIALAFVTARRSRRPVPEAFSGAERLTASSAKSAQGMRAVPMLQSGADGHGTATRPNPLVTTSGTDLERTSG